MKLYELASHLGIRVKKSKIDIAFNDRSMLKLKPSGDSLILNSDR